MPDLLEKLSTINTFFKTFSIPRKFLIIIVILMLVQSLAEVFSAMLLIPFLNSLQNIDNTSTDINIFIRYINILFSGYDQEYKFVYIMLSIIMIMSAVQIMLIINNRFILRFSIFTVQNTVSKIIYNKIINARIKFFYNKRSGDLINSLTMDVKRSFNCVKCMLTMLSNSIFGIAYIVAGFLLLPKYSIGLIIFCGVLVLCFKKLWPYMAKLGVTNRDSQESANNIIIESIQGIRSIIISSLQINYLRKYSDIMYNYFHTIYYNSWITTSLPNFLRFLAFVAICFILLMSKTSIINGGPQIFSQIMFFIFIVMNIFKYFGLVNSTYSSFAFDYKGIQEILLLNAELDTLQDHTPAGIIKLDEFSDCISCKNLSFNYIQGNTILQDVSFTINKNQKVAFVGKSGSGKSTLIDILTGFHDDYEGLMEIDKEDIKNMDKNSWRDLLGYVSQESFIFNDTVKNNLTFGLQWEISDNEIQEACRKAQILETILSFENKFDTILGERGIRLSGGEKQRISIARLFLRDPIIVFLDEATSALDSESEKRVKNALDNLSEGRTVIAVAHRLSTISDFDIIYVLEKGKIVEFGSHTDLIAKQGHYYNYFTIQAMGNNNNE